MLANNRTWCALADKATMILTTIATNRMVPFSDHSQSISAGIFDDWLSLRTNPWQNHTKKLWLLAPGLSQTLDNSAMIYTASASLSFKGIGWLNQLFRIWSMRPISHPRYLCYRVPVKIDIDLNTCAYIITYIHIYIYMCVCVCDMNLNWFAHFLTSKQAYQLSLSYPLNTSCSRPVRWANSSNSPFLNRW